MKTDSKTRKTGFDRHKLWTDENLQKSQNYICLDRSIISWRTHSKTCKYTCNTSIYWCDWTWTYDCICELNPKWMVCFFATYEWYIITIPRHSAFVRFIRLFLSFYFIFLLLLHSFFHHRISGRPKLSDSFCCNHKTRTSFEMFFFYSFWTTYNNNYFLITAICVMCIYIWVYFSLYFFLPVFFLLFYVDLTLL